MKKLLLVFSVFTTLSLSAQKKNKDIMFSKSIDEIENFLKTAHPDDPRRMILRTKLVSLKNSSWMNAGKAAYVPMKPVIIDIPKSVVKNKDNDETEEFKKLLSGNTSSHEEKTVKLLNQLLNSDITNKEVILLMKNNSDCNMIVRIQGSEFYNMAVPAHGENSVVVKKGEYQLNSNICDSKYTTSKKIVKNMVIVLNLNKPVLNLSAVNEVKVQTGSTSN